MNSQIFVCIKQVVWDVKVGPNKWDRVTLNGFNKGYPDYLEFIEYPDMDKRLGYYGYRKDFFRPLDEVLSEISIEELTNIPQEA